MGKSNLYNILERLTNLLRAEVRRAGETHGLLPVQIQALSYLSRCNRYSNTPAAVTDYLELTKGTVSQSLLVLERKDFIQKQPDATDGRVVHLIPTPKGKAVLSKMLPPQFIIEAEQNMDENDLESLSHHLTELLRSAQRINQSQSFGVCETCRFLKSEKLGYRCGLTQESLNKSDTKKICREHEKPENII